MYELKLYCFVFSSRWFMFISKLRLQQLINFSCARNTDGPINRLACNIYHSKNCALRNCGMHEYEDMLSLKLLEKRAHGRRMPANSLLHKEIRCVRYLLFKKFIVEKKKLSAVEELLRLSFTWAFWKHRNLIYLTCMLW